MDGSTKDRVANGRLFRLASMSQVLAEYPQVVLDILKGARASRQIDPEGHEYFILQDPTRVESRHELRREDFVRCVSVAKKLGSVPLFRSDPISSSFERIRAYLKVEFADRKDPP